MTEGRISYKRNALRALLWWIAGLGAFGLLTVALDPIETLAKQVTLASVAIVLGGLALVALRRHPIAPCPSCKMELFTAIKAARRSSSTTVRCRHCGMTMHV
jgi:hypothetical protein